MSFYLNMQGYCHRIRWIMPKLLSFIIIATLLIIPVSVQSIDNPGGVGKLNVLVRYAYGPAASNVTVNIRREPTSMESDRNEVTSAIGRFQILQIWPDYSFVIGDRTFSFHIQDQWKDSDYIIVIPQTNGGGTTIGCFINSLLVSASATRLKADALSMEGVLLGADTKGN